MVVNALSAYGSDHDQADIDRSGLPDDMPMPVPSHVHERPGVPIALAFDLEPHGWASLIIVAAQSEIKIDGFGYCTDALGDLVRAAIIIVTGSQEAHIIFDGEPLLWRLSVGDGWQSTLSPPALRLTVRDNSGRSPKDAATADVESSFSTLLTECFVTADDFGKAVSEAAHKVLIEHGEDGYHKRWVQHRFPRRALATLDAALAFPPDPYRLEGPLRA